MTRFALAVLAALATAGLSSAGPVGYDFTGRLTLAFGTSADALGLTYQTPFAGSFTYDPAAVGSPQPDGTYRFSTAGSITFRANGHTFTSDSASPLLVESSNEDWGPDQPYETFHFSAVPADPGLFGGPAGESFFWLSVSRDWFRSYGPQTPPGSLPRALCLDGYEDYRFYLVAVFLGPNYDYSPTSAPLLYVEGDFYGDSLTPAAPEPGSLALAGLGACLALLRWRRRRPA